jgi:hypothetical protein
MPKTDFLILHIGIDSAARLQYDKKPHKTHAPLFAREDVVKLTNGKSCHRSSSHVTIAVRKQGANCVCNTLKTKTYPKVIKMSPEMNEHRWLIVHFSAQSEDTTIDNNTTSTIRKKIVIIFS